MKILKTLSRRTLLFLIALPAVAITVISLGALLSVMTTAAADGQPGTALFGQFVRKGQMDAPAQPQG